MGQPYVVAGGPDRDDAVPTQPPPVFVRVSRGPWLQVEHTSVELGRDPAARIIVPGDRVSRRHALLRWTGTYWVVEDTSRNGIFYDGRRVARHRVPRVCVLRLGGVDGTPVAFVTGPSVVTVPATRPLRMGREQDNDIVVDDLLVSRRHATLRRIAGDRVLLVDEGSANGTFVDGRRVSAPVELADESLIAVGRHAFRFIGGLLVTDSGRGDVVLHATGLSVVSDKGEPLLQDVDLAVRRGEVLAVAGPSGAGKSTLIGALTGARPAPRGEVLVEGQDLYRDYEQLRSMIGYVPQDDILHLSLRLRDVLRYSAQLRFAADTSRAEQDDRVEKVLADLGLAERADQRVGKLSGGQRKRANVALEVLTRPSLLFLDEPTSGLDPGTDTEVMGRVRTLAEAGATVVVVTHSLIALEHSDRVLFLAPGGRVAYLGPPQEAPAYFGQPTLADVFRLLEHEAQRDWTGEFRQRAENEADIAVDQLQVPPATPVSGPRVLRHLSVLVHRYAAVIAADRRNLAILLVQAPLLGLLSRALVGDQGLDRTATEPNPEARRLLLTLVVSACWLGASNAVREIVKELPIYERERRFGLSPVAYLASKVGVLAALTVVQSLILVAVAIAGHPVVTHGALFGTGVGELVLDVTASGLAAMTLGLLISAIASTADKAVALLPLLVVPQLVLSGGLLALRDLPLLDTLSRMAPARWGYAAAASTVDLARLEAPPEADRSGSDFSDPMWRHNADTWAKNTTALALLSAASLAAAYIALRSKPIRLRRRLLAAEGRRGGRR